MFSKIKSLLNDSKKDGHPQVGSPLRRGGPKIWTMSKAMREAFERGGCKYNIRVVIRGCRGTGKSALLSRLHGHEFNFNHYTPTGEIAAATIKYSTNASLVGMDEGGSGNGTASPPPQHQQKGGDRRASGATQNPPQPAENEDANVKVDVWDVVDEGFIEESQSTGAGKGKELVLPIKGQSAEEADRLRQAQLAVADSRSIDVYRGCHGAILLVDCRKPETLQYVVEEVRRIPATCAICIALNFIDVPRDQHKITERDIHDLVKTLPRAMSPMVQLASQGKAPERLLSIAPSWCSLSARTEVGMDVLRSFFTVAVALVKLETLETQMKQIYAQVEVHQGLMLQQRAVMLFEEKERAKRAAEEEDRRLHPEKYPPPPPSPLIPPAPQQQQQTKATPATTGGRPSLSAGSGSGSFSAIPSSPGSPTVSVGSTKQTAAGPASSSTPSATNTNSVTSAITAASVNAAAAAPPPHMQSLQQRILLKQKQEREAAAAAAQKRTGPRTEEDEKRLQDDFYGDVSSDDEDAAAKAKGKRGHYDESDSEDDAVPPKAVGGRQQHLEAATTATTTSTKPSTSSTVLPTSSPLQTSTSRGPTKDDDDVTTSSDEEERVVAVRRSATKSPTTVGGDAVGVPEAAAPASPVMEPAEPTFDIGDAAGEGVKDDFFGSDSDEEEDADDGGVGANDIAAGNENAVAATTATAADQPTESADDAPTSDFKQKSTNSDDDDEDGDAAQQQLASSSSQQQKPTTPHEPPKPRVLGNRKRADSDAEVVPSTSTAMGGRRDVSVAVANSSTAEAPPSTPAIDVAALLAQMQAVMGEDGGGGDSESVSYEGGVKEKKSKKDKEDKKEKKDKKKDKADKKEKSDKKEKRSKKAAKGSESDEDGGFDEGGSRYNNDDDGGFEEMR